MGVDGVDKVGFPLRIKLYTKGSVQHSLNKHINCHLRWDPFTLVKGVWKRGAYFGLIGLT